MTAAVHWLLAVHAPASPPDVIAPAAVLVFINSPVTTVVDALNAVPAVRDVALASWLVLAALAGVTTIWVQRLGVTPWLAVALGVGITFLPGAWSTQAPGRDAVVLLGLVALAGALSTPGPGAGAGGWHRGVGLATLALLLVGHQPMVVWLLLPVAFAGPRTQWRARAWWAVAALLVAVCVTLIYTRVSMDAAACAAGEGGLATWLWDVARPGASPGAGAAGRLVRLGSSMAVEVHVFGLAAAMWALWLVGDAHPALRRVTVASLIGLAAGAALGTVTAHLLVAAATVTWLPWFALACHRLAAFGRTGSRLVTQLMIVWVAVGLPLARHAVFVPDPVARGAPALWSAAYAGIDGMVVAGTEADARLGRRAGRLLVPAEVGAVGRCLAPARTVTAVGAAVDTLRDTGITVDEMPMTVPLAALPHDLRPGAVVALALTADGTRWLRPNDITRVAQLGADADAMRRRGAQAVVSVIPASPARDGTPAPLQAVASTRRLEAAGDRVLWHPVSVEVEPGAVRIMSGAPVPQPIVLGDTAALVVFDRTERPVIRASATATPGLPMPLYSTLPTLRLGRVIAVTPQRGVPRPVPLLPAELPPPIDADAATTVPVHAGSGWHDAEAAGRMAFRWSARRDATAVFRLARPARLLITVDASPAQTTARPNALHVRVNDVIAARDVDGMTTIDVPASATRQGHNTLSFESAAVVPAGTLAGEPRSLGAVVRHVRVVRR